nr:hypothetical protein [Mucilaginibacter sp. SP1R1]
MDNTLTFILQRHFSTNKLRITIPWNVTSPLKTRLFLLFYAVNFKPLTARNKTICFTCLCFKAVCHIVFTDTF